MGILKGVRPALRDTDRCNVGHCACMVLHLGAQPQVWCCKVPGASSATMLMWQKEIGTKSPHSSAIALGAKLLLTKPYSKIIILE